MKPRPDRFQIVYNAAQAYEPDFVVEARDATFIIVAKARNEMDDPVVQANAAAART